MPAERRYLVPLLAPILALFLAACSSLSTSVDFDTAAEFGALRSYAWIEPVPTEKGSSLALQRVRAAVDKELAARGYHLDSAAPDFLVAAHVGSRERVQVTNWGYTVGTRHAWMGSPEIDVYTFDEGSLVIDVVDPKQRELLWRGSASRAIDAGWKPEKREAVIRDAVEKLLARFPPDAKK